MSGLISELGSRPASARTNSSEELASASSSNDPTLPLLGNYEDPIPTASQPKQTQETLITITETPTPSLSSIPESDIAPYQTFLVSDPDPGENISLLPKVPVIHAKENFVPTGNTEEERSQSLLAHESAQQCILELQDVKDYYGPNAMISHKKRHILGLEAGLTLRDIHPAPLKFFEKIKSSYGQDKESFKALMRDHFGWNDSHPEAETDETADQRLKAYHEHLTLQVHSQQPATQLQLSQEQLARLRKLSHWSVRLAALQNISFTFLATLLGTRWFSIPSVSTLQETGIYQAIRNSSITSITHSMGTASFYSLCETFFANGTAHTSLMSEINNNNTVFLPNYFSITPDPRLVNATQGSLESPLFNFDFNPWFAIVPGVCLAIAGLINFAFFKCSGLNAHNNPLQASKNLGCQIGTMAISFVFSLLLSIQGSPFAINRGIASLLACNSTFTPINSSLPTQTYGFQNYGTIVNATNRSLMYMLVISGVLSGVSIAMACLIPRLARPSQGATSRQTANPNTTSMTMPLFQSGIATASAAIGVSLGTQRRVPEAPDHDPYSHLLA